MADRKRRKSVPPGGNGHAVRNVATSSSISPGGSCITKKGLRPDALFGLRMLSPDHWYYIRHGKKDFISFTNDTGIFAFHKETPAPTEERPLPALPAGFNCVLVNRAEDRPLAIPRYLPCTALSVGQADWHPACYEERRESYYLSSVSQPELWLLWVQRRGDSEDIPDKTQLIAYGPRAAATAFEAAVHLLLIYWRESLDELFSEWYGGTILNEKDFMAIANMACLQRASSHEPGEMIRAEPSTRWLANEPICYSVDEAQTILFPWADYPYFRHDVYDISLRPEVIVEEIKNCGPLRRRLDFEWNDWETIPPATLVWIVKDWLISAFDGFDTEEDLRYFGQRGEALCYFKALTPETYEKLAVVIVEDDTSTPCYAAKLSSNIADANSAAERLGLGFRFKRVDRDLAK